MKKLQNLIIAASLLLTPWSAQAGGDCDDDSCNMKADFCESGCAYEDCRRAPNVSPTLALGFVVTVAVVALLVVNGDSRVISAHSHS